MVFSSDAFALCRTRLVVCSVLCCVYWYVVCCAITMHICAVVRYSVVCYTMHSVVLFKMVFVDTCKTYCIYKTLTLLCKQHKVDMYKPCRYSLYVGAWVLS